MGWLRPWLVTLVTLTLCSVRSNTVRILDTFSVPEFENERSRLVSLAFEPRTGDVFVASVNKVFRLSPALHQNEVITVGPYDDSPMCPPPNLGNCTCPGLTISPQACNQQTRVPTRNIVKGMLVDSLHQQLIVFGSVYHGSVQQISLSNSSNRGQIYGGLFRNTVRMPVVAMLGHGPGDIDALYIASSRNLPGGRGQTLPVVANDTWSNPPLIATRRLAGLDIASSNDRGQTAVFFRPEFQNETPVHFKYTFTYDGTIYFLVTQPQSEFSQKFQSRIIRVCQEDQYYNSYAELHLSCQLPQSPSPPGGPYNIVTAATVGPIGVTLAEELGIPLTTSDLFLYASFARSYENSMDVMSDSRLCVFSVNEIRLKFAEMTNNCFQGGTMSQLGPAHITEVTPCTRFTRDSSYTDPSQPVTVNERYCGVYAANTPLESVTVNASALVAVHVMGHLVKTISNNVVHNETLVYLGTDRGRMLQMVLESAEGASQLPELRFELDRSVEASILPELGNNSLILMTKQRVLRVDLADCGDYRDCQSCMAVRNPHCGWCLWTKRCGLKTECREGGWLSTWTMACPHIKLVRPETLELIQANKTVITLDIDFLPSGEEVEQVLTCEVRRGSFVAEVRSSPMLTRLVCNRFTFPPGIAAATGSTVMTISVKFQGDVIASSSLIVYDCTRITSCSACTNGTLACAWCPESHRCAYASNVHSPDVCMNEAFIYGQAVNDMQKDNVQYRSTGAAACPRIEVPENEIILASGSASHIRLYGYNLKVYHEPLSCRFHLPGVDPVTVPADRFDSNGVTKIQCNDYMLSYPGDTPFILVPVDAIWNHTRVLDNPDNIKIKLYKCEFLMMDCGRCLTMDEDYQCGWCGNACRVQRDCVSVGQWIGRDGICPNPQIYRFTPQSGPTSGGTLLTVHGINLGKTPADIRNGVQVAEIPCDVQDEGYEPSTTFICETGSTHVSKNGTINVTVSDLYSTGSSYKYDYKDPTVGTFTPHRGPLSGGTLVTVSGTHLDSGSNVRVTIGNRDAKLVRRNHTVLEFKTPRQTFTIRQEIDFLFDRTTISTKDAYSYLEDPTVTRVNTTAALYSGGSLMEFRGTNLHIIAHPKLEVTFKTQAMFLRTVATHEKTVEMDCHANDSTLLTCPTPDLRDEPVLAGSVEASYGLVMDDVVDLRSLSSDFAPLVIYPDPEVDTFTQVLKYQDGIEVRIEGSGLDVFRHVSGLLVSVGGNPCNVSVVHEGYITCTPPKQVALMDANGQALVVMSLGAFRVEVGSLLYAGTTASKLPLILGVVFGVALPIILVILLLVLCLRRQNQLQKRMRKRRNIYNGGGLHEASYSSRNRGNRYATPEEMPLRSDGPIEEVPLPVVRNGKQEVVSVHPPLRHQDAFDRHSDPMAKSVSTSSAPDELAPVPDYLPPRYVGGATADPGEPPALPKKKKSKADLDRSVVKKGGSKDAEDEKSMASQEDEESAVPPGYLENLMNRIDDDELKRTVEEVLVSRDKIELGRVLGKGHFGRVYYGKMTEDDDVMEVAVKTLQGRYLDPMAVESFLKEGVMMKNFDHPHVLRLLGVSINGPDFPMVILPYMSNGDLRSYVKDKSKSFTARQLLHLAQQVAEGMTYLACLNFVHRDLAARNCMVCENKVVKVADFGLSKDLYDKDYYASKDRKRKMPIKWMALESLEDYIFTTKSDVWAFGVLMWELLTRGVTPYPDVDVFEVRNFLASGRRLRQPKYCPENIYRIMTACWNKDPSERPTFVDLVNRLELIINPPKKKVSVQPDVDPDQPLYVNLHEIEKSSGAGASSHSNTSDGAGASSQVNSPKKPAAPAAASQPPPPPKKKSSGLSSSPKLPARPALTSPAANEQTVIGH